MELDMLALKLRVLDFLAQNPDAGFGDLLSNIKAAKATLARVLNGLAEEGLITISRPEKLGRGRKSNYKLTAKGEELLREKRIVLSIIQDININTRLHPEGPQPVSLTFFMGERGLSCILVRLHEDIGKKLFEKLGGAEGVKYYQSTGELPPEGAIAASRIAQGINAIMISASDMPGPVIVTNNGATTILPPEFDQPLAQLVDNPEGLQFLKIALKLYKSLKNGKANSLAPILQQFGPEVIQKMARLL